MMAMLRRQFATPQGYMATLCSYLADNVENLCAPPWVLRGILLYGRISSVIAARFLFI